MGRLWARARGEGDRPQQCRGDLCVDGSATHVRGAGGPLRSPAVSPESWESSSFRLLGGSQPWRLGCGGLSLRLPPIRFSSPHTRARGSGAPKPRRLPPVLGRSVGRVAQPQAGLDPSSRRRWLSRVPLRTASVP